MPEDAAGGGQTPGAFGPAGGGQTPGAFGTTQGGAGIATVQSKSKEASIRILQRRRLLQPVAVQIQRPRTWRPRSRGPLSRVPLSAAARERRECRVRWTRPGCRSAWRPWPWAARCRTAGRSRIRTGPRRRFLARERSGESGTLLIRRSCISLGRLNTRPRRISSNRRLPAPRQRRRETSGAGLSADRFSRVGCTRLVSSTT